MVWPDFETAAICLHHSGFHVETRRGRKAWTGTTTDRGKKAVFLVLLLVLGSCAGVPTQLSSAVFSVGGNTVARAGEETLLFCNHENRTADPPSSYVWVKDGKVSPGHTRQVLTLSSVTRQDAGYYQCGTPDSSSYGQGVHLHVFVPGDVLPKPNLQVIGWQIAGRSVSLYCHFFHDYISSPATSYTWYKDSVEVKGQKGDFLHFPNLAETDQGDYTCTAREGTPETTSPPSYEVDLRILVPAQVQIKPPGPVVRGVRGENLTLTCEVTRAFPGVPDDGYSWSYFPYPKGPQRSLEGKTNILTLGPLTLEDRGQYVCQARNDQMYRHLDFTLGGNASVTVDVVYLDNLALTADLEVSEGDRVTLTCAVDSRPTAQLTWTVHGQEVRHVTDNLDHYVISRAACSDSGSYTCGASNTELPGRDRHATLQLYVHCNHAPIADTIEMKLAAIFNFPLPDWTPVVVVHPGGHDVISVGQDCSYVSPAFQSRCLQPWCDSKRHRLSFTLTNVTEEDEGEYVCLEEGPHRRPIYNCSKKLHMKKCLLDMSEGDRPSSSVIALACLAAVLAAFLIGMLVQRTQRHLLQYLIRVLMNLRGGGHTEGSHVKKTHREQLSAGGEEGTELVENGPVNKTLTFDGLYEKGKVYVIPLLVPPNEKPTSVTELETEDETQPLIPHPDQNPSVEEEEFEVKNLLRTTLQTCQAEDLPSFLLHNTGLSKQENVVLVLDKRLGVVVMIVNTAMSRKNLHQVEEAARHLVEAKDTVRRKLRGLVPSGAVQAVLSLPCLTQDKADKFKKSLKVLHSHPDVEMLAGQDARHFRQWAERLGSKHVRKGWKSSSQAEDLPDSVYKKVASRFLTLAGCTALEESIKSPDPVETLLLTPAQMEVRDGTARLLHVWGPPGSGKTTLLVHRARQWLAEGKAVILAVGGQFYDIQLAEIDRAVRKGLGKETYSRIRVCSTVYEMQRAVKVLKGTYADVEVCLIVDILWEICILKLLLPDVKSGSLSCIWTAGWDSLHSVPTDLSKQMQDLGWESLHLPDCIRCTDNTVELLNQLGRGKFPPITSCSVPRDEDIPALTVVDHCLHPDHTNTVSNCVHCKGKMTTVLPPMTQGLRLNNWVALHTGDHNKFDESEPAKEAVEQFGVPIFYDSDSSLRHEAVLSSSPSHQYSADVPNFADFRSRVLDGVDKEGQPTLHLLQVDDFKGMEREGVILVHWDERDNDPERQSLKERATRLEEHRRQWIQAASRSTGQVILLLLSPSPARSLLGLPEAAMP